jgi:hypothetical protein
VPTGTHNRLVPTVNEVQLPFPRPEFSIFDALQIFNSKDMAMEDMVTLLEIDTVGMVASLKLGFTMNVCRWIVI